MQQHEFRTSMLIMEIKVLFMEVGKLIWEGEGPQSVTFKSIKFNSPPKVTYQLPNR